jgi:hypothetical protein
MAVVRSAPAVNDYPSVAGAETAVGAPPLGCETTSVQGRSMANDSPVE